VELNITPGASRETRQGRRSWARLVGTTAAVLAVGAATVTLTGPAEALDTAHIGAADASGFPAYYTDDAGTSLQLCIDGGANCGGATATDDGAGGPGISVAPDGEGFYWSADVTLNSARGSLHIVLAHEGAWASATQPIVFDRTRVRGTLSKAGTYRLLTPYGTTKVVADADGIVNQTADPFCALAAGGACSPRMTNWLRAVNAPVGYVGNSVAETRFTGGTVRNEFVLQAPNGSVIGRQPRAILMGKLAAGPAAVLSSDSVDFGNTDKVAHRSVGLKNQGTAALSLQNISVAGANTIKVDPTGCAARASLASGASCAVNLTYRPGKLKTSKATLVVNDNTIVGAHRVPVKAMTSSEFSARRAVSFKPVKVGSRSNTRRVVVTNTGVQPLRIKGIALNGSGARSFERRSGQAPVCAKGSVIKPRSSCGLYVGFAPKSFGAKTASLTVRTNAASSPDQVRLTGRGR
jgi:hypothetical protein